jgi:hypothetical protein
MPGPLFIAQLWTSICPTGIRTQSRTDKPNPMSAHEDAVDSSLLLTPTTRQPNTLTRRMGSCAANRDNNAVSWTESFIGFI